MVNLNGMLKIIKDERYSIVKITNRKTNALGSKKGE